MRRRDEGTGPAAGIGHPHGLIRCSPSPGWLVRPRRMPVTGSRVTDTLASQGAKPAATASMRPRYDRFLAWGRSTKILDNVSSRMTIALPEDLRETSVVTRQLTAHHPSGNQSHPRKRNPWRENTWNRRVLLLHRPVRSLEEGGHGPTPISSKRGLFAAEAAMPQADWTIPAATVPISPDLRKPLGMPRAVTRARPSRRRFVNLALDGTRLLPERLNACKRRSCDKGKHVATAAPFPDKGWCVRGGDKRQGRGDHNGDRHGSGFSRIAFDKLIGEGRLGDNHVPRGGSGISGSGGGSIRCSTACRQSGLCAACWPIRPCG